MTTLTHPRMRELADALATHRAALLDAAAQVPAQWQEAPPDAETWSAAQVLHHVALAESSSGRMVTVTFRRAREAGLSRDEATSSVLAQLDHTDLAKRELRVRAPSIVEPAPSVTMADAHAALATSRERTLAALPEFDGWDLANVSARHPVFGELTLYQWLLAIALHDVRHRLQLESLAAR